ncbi:hypothetical protein CDL15_Pgr001036 [Punica granatum]|uniref:Uncharacterized protein n=1 Tax=Punica granatum TaxID=22663 RepID=A0A218WZJ5_PUNGR|nr:hypothetical protein CDL15_Pgr001036 [Punica granatum]
MYPPRSRRQRQSNKPFNLDACVSTKIKRHPGANWAFPTAKTHHRQHATTSPGAGHIRLQECLSSKKHPPRERQCTIGSGDRTRRPAQITKTGASPSNIQAKQPWSPTLLGQFCFLFKQ